MTKRFLQTILLFSFFTFFGFTNLFAQTPDPCDDFSDGGEVISSQVLILGQTPYEILNLTYPTVNSLLASGPVTPVYQWMIACAPDDPYDMANYSPIPGATGESYQPDPITKTTYLIRCAMPAGCGSLQVESNLVILDLDQSLPVELTSFTVTDQGNTGALIKWVSATEIDHQFYEVQHSLDGKRFETLEIVDGQGTKEDPTSYSYIHKNPIPGENYYRLKMVGISQEFEFSDIFYFNRLNENKLELTYFPNPVRSTVAISLMNPSDIVGDLFVFDNNHRLIKQLTIPASTYRFDLDFSDLKDGIYQVNVRTKNLRETFQIVKFTN